MEMMLCQELGEEYSCKMWDDASVQLYFCLKIVTMKVISINEVIVGCLLQKKNRSEKRIDEIRVSAKMFNVNKGATVEGVVKVNPPY